MSRLDKIKEHHPEFNISLIDMLAKVDPTDTYKYVEFLIKELKTVFIDDKASDIGLNLAIHLLGSDNVETLNEFEKHSKANRIKEKDISKYENFLEMEKQVKIAKEIVKRKELEKQVIKIYESDGWLVVIPLSYEASKMYGSGTKWCTTQEKHWNEYTKNYKLIYIISRTDDVKYAVSYKYIDEKIQGWQANDEELNPMLFGVPSQVIISVIENIQKGDRVMYITPKEPSKKKKSLDGYYTWVGDDSSLDINNLISQYGRYFQNNVLNVSDIINNR